MFPIPKAQLSGEATVVAGPRKRDMTRSQNLQLRVGGRHSARPAGWRRDGAIHHRSLVSALA